MQLSRSQVKHNIQQTNEVAAVLQAHMRQYGYELVETPIIDSADLFLTKAGDQIISRLFTFERHGQQLALRPEFTASAANQFVEKHLESTALTRWQFSGPIFEDDPSDLTRHYQRYSIGAELIGSAEISTEAEIISMVAHGLTKIGIEDYTIAIGHVGLMRHILDSYGLDNRFQRFLLNQRHNLNDAKSKGDLLHQLDTMLVNSSVADIPVAQYPVGARTQEDIMRRLQQKRERVVSQEQFFAAIDFLQQWTAINDTPANALKAVENIVPMNDELTRRLLQDWEQLLDLLQVYDIPIDRISIRPDLARSWEYYTGIVFELCIGKSVIAGGGRYDELIGFFGAGHMVPAVGFAYYVDTLLSFLPPTVNPQSQIFSLAANTPTLAAKWAYQLRKYGLHVAVIQQVTKATLTAQNNEQISFHGKVYQLSEIAGLMADLEHSE